MSKPRVRIEILRIVRDPSGPFNMRRVESKKKYNRKKVKKYDRNNEAD